MAITNLTNTKWYLNDTLEPMGEYIESGWFGPGYSTHYTINFTANDVAFCELGCEFFESPASGASDRIGELQYKYVSPEGLDPCELPYDYLSSQWYAYAEPYRTITITGGEDVTNSELIAWLEANATQLSIEDTGGTPDNTPDDDNIRPVDLTNTSWYFNETLYHNDIGDVPEEIMLYPGLEKSFNVTFDANNKQYIAIGYYLQSGPGHGSYLNYINSEESDDDNPFYPEVWGGQDWSEETGYSSCGWNNEAYRTITITGGDDVTNPDLITWITSNARQINNNDGPDPGGDPDLPIDTPDEDRTPTFTFDLSTLNLAAGTYTIYTKLSAEEYRDSEPSNEVTYEAGSGDLPQLNPAAIVLDGNFLNICDDSGISTFATIYVDGKPMATVEMEGEVEEPLDPTFNHYGVIPEGAEYLLMNSDTGEEEYYTPGDAFPDINANGDHLYCYPGLLVYVYNSENNTWAANDHGTTIEDNVIFLESINGAPMTAINSTFQQTGIEDVEDATRLREDITHVTIPKSVTFIAVWAFYNCSNLANITYTGTMEQWNSIELEDKWNRHCPEITVTCTDGTVTIPAYGS